MNENAFCRSKDGQGTAKQEFSPPVDIVLDGASGMYRIVVDLPGVDEGDIEVRAHEGELEISAGVAERAVEGEVLRCEVPHRSYLRRFRLADDIDVDRIGAHLEAGVLTVELPRVAAKQPKRIEVRCTH